jgi:predicted transcriptional regulator
MCKHGRPNPDECPKCLADDMYRASSVADPTPDYIPPKDPCQHGWERSDCVHCSPPRYGTYNGFYPAPAEPEPDDGGKYDDLYLPRSALAALPRGEPLIDGVIDRHTVFVIAGRDQSFKSFLVLDWLCCLATGKPWLNKHVEQCRVLYVVGEGAWGLNDRVTAWETAYGQHVEDEWFTVRRAPVNLFRHSGAFADMTARIRDEQYGVVVFDTLQRMSSGADQNAAKDAGVIISALDELRHLTHNGAVGVVAHTDKGDNDTRGSSAFEDDADIVWRMRRDEDEQIVTATLAKRKDGPDGEAHRLRPEVIKGTDSLILMLASGLRMGASLKHPARTEDVLRVLSMTIHAESGASISAVSEILGLKGKGTVHNAMNWLLDRGYVRIEGRGRNAKYKITTSGSSMLEELEETYD